MKTIYSHITKARAVNHTIFWLTWVCSFTIIQSFGSKVPEYGAWLVYYLVTLPLYIAHTYAIAYWLVPQYFFKYRYLVFALWIMALFILSSVLELLISNELVWELVKPVNIHQGNYLSLQNILINGLGNEYIIIVFLSMKVVRFWNLKVGEQAALKNKKLSTEVELLQYQLYPRFVLNVMDRLENMAETDSPQTSEMIIRLSNLMTNMTTGHKSEKILLQKEIDMIRSYIDIHRMSFSQAFHINFFVTGDLNRLQIPPFLFFQLVEEGFVLLEDSPEKPDYAILIKTEPHYLLFSLTLWNEQALKRQFNPQVLKNCQKYLSYFYPENHKVMSNFEINFVELTIEIYL